MYFELEVHMAMFVMGVEGAMRVYEEAPVESGYTANASRGGKWQTHYGWPGGQVWFHAKRGILEEFKGYTSGRHVHIRHIPEEMLEEVQEADRKVAEAEAILAKARADRQLTLKVAAVRGARVRVEETRVWDVDTKTFIPRVPEVQEG